MTSLLAGGGRGGLGDVLAQLLALLLLAVLAWSSWSGRLSWRVPFWLRCLPLLALLLPLIQLLPIPADWWAAGSAREAVAAQLAIAGIEPAGRWTLYPLATERALWSLLPGVALFLAALALSDRALRWLFGALLLVGVVNVCFGVAQLAQGPESPLRLYVPTNTGHAVGLFANRNHFAGFLAMLLPLTLAGSAWSLVRRKGNGERDFIMPVLGALLSVTFVLGIAFSRSRAGLGLALLGMLALLPLAWSLPARRGTKRILATIVALGLLVSVQFASLDAARRAMADPVDAGRRQYAATTMDAARAYSPMGSGIGTFRFAYQPFEALRGDPGRDVVNHAHNDYLELWMEGGVLALLLLLSSAAVWAWAGLRAWRTPADEAGKLDWNRFLARACWVAISLAALHEAFDYAMRTTAMSTAFALILATMFAHLRYPSNAPAARPGVPPSVEPGNLAKLRPFRQTPRKE
ncbi:O-antigen ligase family protein [Arenimonas sp.]|uniref:O-antigen ligase family protein n=1 Tax=Arenimonas sp. TaxID=1872635 RepID=UPI0039E6F177